MARIKVTASLAGIRAGITKGIAGVDMVVAMQARWLASALAIINFAKQPGKCLKRRFRDLKISLQILQVYRLVYKAFIIIRSSTKYPALLSKQDSKIVLLESDLSAFSNKLSRI